jgi:hypothetical protein
MRVSFRQTKRLFNTKQLLDTIGNKTNLYLFRKQLEKDGRFQIDLSEFYSTSAKFSIPENEAKVLVNEWNKLGLVILENQNVIIKPEIVYKKFHDSFNLTNEVSALKDKVEKITKELASLDVIKNDIDDRARASLRRVAWMSSLYLTVQLGVLMHMTWIDYGWDVVEPLSYFCSFLTVYIGAIYFMFFKGEYQYEDVYVKMFKSKTAKLYIKEKFDIANYEKLKTDLEELNKQIEIKALI